MLLRAYVTVYILNINFLLKNHEELATFVLLD